LRTPKAKIQYKYGDTITVKPVYDVHLGSTACDVKAFKNWLADSDENTYFLGGGDLFDSIVVNDVRYRKSGDATKGDAIIDNLVDMGQEYLEPYKDRILGLGTGNHEDVVTKRCGTDPIARLSRRLGVEHIGYSGLFRLQLDEGGNRGRTVIIRYHHGWGGGSRTVGADLTKYSKDIMYWDADIFLYGHTHQRKVDSIPRMGLVGSKLISKPKIIGVCGTFLKTYTTDIQPTYAEVKGYPPVEISGISVTIRPDNKWVKLNARLGY
jgi:hypothetical protein